MQNLSGIYQLAIILSQFITGAIYQTSNVIYRVGLQILLEQVGAFLILLLGQNFLGLTYIIVYIGALAIQFLFVIMMLKPSHTPSLPPYLSLLQVSVFILYQISQYYFVSLTPADALSTLGVSYEAITESVITPNWTNCFQEQTDIESMGYMIYVTYPLILVYVGISLLLVLIGIVVVLGVNRQ